MQGRDVAEFDVFPGTLFERTCRWSIDGTAVNITGYTGKMVVKSSAGTTLHEATSGNGGFSIVSAVDGRFKLKMPISITSTLTPDTTCTGYVLLTAPSSEPIHLFDVRLKIGEAKS